MGSPEDARTAFPELELLWQSIFKRVEEDAGERYLLHYEMLVDGPARLA